MKKIGLILVAVISFFVFNDKVNAYVYNRNATIECYYGNGVVAGFSYDSNGGNYSAYIRDFPLAKTSIIDGEEISSFSFYNNTHAVDNLKSLTCPPSIRYFKVWTSLEAGSTDKSYKGIYSFSWCTDNHLDSQCTHKYNSDGKCTNCITDALQQETVVGWFFGDIKEATAGTINVTGTGLLEQSKPEAKIPLVGERIKFVDDIGDTAYGHTYKIEVENAQAVGNNKYAQIFKGGTIRNGKLIASGQYFLQVGRTVTTINSLYASKERLCIKESTVIEDASSGDTSKKFSSIRHIVSEPKKDGDKYTCSSGQLYVRTTDVCKIKTGSVGESFCDKYSNTAFVIADIIKIMQVVVPAIVIVFTGIEIGRIVLAGNIEEELPKRKKNIIIRLIVMIAFFFLPIITQLIISLAEGVSILDVSCLFNDGQSTVENESLEQNCVAADDAGTSGSSGGSGTGGSNITNDKVNQTLK